MKLTEFADILNLDIEINRHANQSGRYSVSFSTRVDFKSSKSSSILSGIYGSGKTIQEAIDNFLIKIKDYPWLIIDAVDKEKRREFGIPDIDSF